MSIKSAPNISKGSLGYCGLALSAAFLLGACSDGEATSTAPAASPVALVAEVRPASAPELSVAGRVVARHAALAVSESGGRVLEIKALVGERVREGQVLAVLEAAIARQNAAAAVAEQAQAVSQLEEQSARLERARGLLAAGVGTQAELESATAAASAARASLAAAQAASAQAQRAQAETIVRAPVTGVIAARRIETGQMLDSGAPAFEIDGDGPREIEATIPEGALARLSPGAIVAFSSAGAQGQARFVAAASRTRAGGARVARFAVEGAGPPTGATVELQLQAEDQLAQALVPVASIIADPGGARRVLAVGKDGALRAVPVEPVSLSAAGMLVRGALQPGERVVAAGADFLKPGTRVRPVETRS